MPSLLKRFRHRKTSSSASSASASSLTSPTSPPGPFNSAPSSPSPATAQSQSQSTTSASADAGVGRRASLPHSPRRSDLANPSFSVGGGLVDRSEDDVVVIGRGPKQTGLDAGYDNGIPILNNSGNDTGNANPNGDSEPALDTEQTGRDATGHSQPFRDESDRPDLPTTTSNVHNPAPDASQLSWRAQKVLPALPEVKTPLTPLTGSSTLDEFPLPPGATRETASHGTGFFSHATGGSTAHQLPHVDSVDRTRLQEATEHRPSPVLASSDPGGRDAPRFPHVDSLPAHSLERDSRGEGDAIDVDGEWSKETLEALEIPARNTSLRPSVNPASRFSTTSNAAGASAQNLEKTAGPGAYTLPLPDLHNVRDPDLTPEQHIANHLAKFSIFHTPISPEKATASYVWGDTPALKAAREEMVARIAGEAYTREMQRGDLSGDGVRVFEQCGFGDRVGKKGTVEVHTQWLEPVVQETIRRTEHNEYFYIIDREIHKYHIYPKIQPIHDPNPIVHPTRHRIFSSADGKWHEVVGDAAAIEILGEEVFRQGPQERRGVRRLALPGLGVLNGDVDLQTDEVLGGRNATGAGAGSGIESATVGGRVLEREGTLGGPLGEWKEVGSGGWITELVHPATGARREPDARRFGRPPQGGPATGSRGGVAV